VGGCGGWAARGINMDAFASGGRRGAVAHNIRLDLVDGDVTPALMVETSVAKVVTLVERR
jgi:hypothetical protein